MLPPVIHSSAQSAGGIIAYARKNAWRNLSRRIDRDTAG